MLERVKKSLDSNRKKIQKRKNRLTMNRRKKLRVPRDEHLSNRFVQFSSPMLCGKKRKIDGNLCQPLGSQLYDYDQNWSPMYVQ